MDYSQLDLFNDIRFIGLNLKNPLSYEMIAELFEIYTGNFSQLNFFSEKGFDRSVDKALNNIERSRNYTTPSVYGETRDSTLFYLHGLVKQNRRIVTTVVTEDSVPFTDFKVQNDDIILVGNEKTWFTQLDFSLFLILPMFFIPMIDDVEHMHHRRDYHQGELPNLSVVAASGVLMESYLQHSWTTEPSYVSKDETSYRIVLNNMSRREVGAITRTHFRLAHEFSQLFVISDDPDIKYHKKVVRSSVNASKVPGALEQIYCYDEMYDCNSRTFVVTDQVDGIPLPYVSFEPDDTIIIDSYAEGGDYKGAIPINVPDHRFYLNPNQHRTKGFINISPNYQACSVLRALMLEQSNAHRGNLLL